MDSGPGIAGSTRPEDDGIFVCTSETDIDIFVRISGAVAFGCADAR